MTVGDRIRKRRKEKNLTQTKLSKISGVGFGMIGHYERDECDLSLFNATCIADALGVTLDWLARGERQGG